MIRRPNKETVAYDYYNNIASSDRNIIPCWDHNNSRMIRHNDKC